MEKCHVEGHFRANAQAGNRMILPLGPRGCRFNSGSPTNEDPCPSGVVLRLRDGFEQSGRAKDPRKVNLACRLIQCMA
jgi:hypothetical protein